MNNIIYFDNSATTRIYDEVFDKMKEFLLENYSNPSSVYEFAQKSRVAIEKSRENIANYINAGKNEVFFTSSGTEANNWALLGSTILNGNRGGHIITTSFEHPSVLETIFFLEQNGYEVTYIKPDLNGIIDLVQIEKAIRPDTVLISVMYVNNEIGVIQDIKELSKLIKSKNEDIVFHVDAVQALSELHIDVKDLGIDLLSLSAHKIHGPKGIGLLFIKSGVNISNFMHGGSQERSRRAGTENVAGIVGFSKAIDILKSNLIDNRNKRFELRNYLIDKLNKNINNFVINGSMKNRHSGNVNISFLGVDKEIIIMNMDIFGICISAGSACSSGSIEKSHVLESMDLDEEVKSSAIRISLGEDNTFEEIDIFIDRLILLLNRGRNFE